MIIGSRHTGIVVRNLEEMLKFYVEILGLSIHSRKIESGEIIDTFLRSGVEVEIIKLSASKGIVVELLHFKNYCPIGFSNHLLSKGITHFALSVDNIESLAKQLDLRVVESDNGKHKVTFCVDPERNCIELVEEIC